MSQSDTTGFGGGLDVDENGWSGADDIAATGCPDVFVAGDVRRNRLNQVMTAAADGLRAAPAIDTYLDRLEAEMKPAPVERAGPRNVVREAAG